jgi:hypothetical protein
VFVDAELSGGPEDDDHSTVRWDPLAALLDDLPGPRALLPIGESSNVVPVTDLRFCTEVFVALLADGEV